MIRLFLLLLAAIPVAWFVAEQVGQHGSGYVLLYYNHWSVEIVGWLALLLLFALVLIFYLLIRLVHNAGKLAVIGKRQRFNRFLKNRQRFVEALLEENWAEAAEAANKSAGYDKNESLDELVAVKAALSAREPDEASAYLKKAIERKHLPQPMVSLLRYDLLCQQQQHDRAALLLETLLHQHGKHIAVLERAVTAYCKARQFSLLEELLPDLSAKMPALHRERQAELLSCVAECLFEQATAKQDIKLLKKRWKSFARGVAKDRVLPLYCRALILLKADDEAEKKLSDRLDKQFDADCLVPFAMVQSNDREKQLGRLEALKPEHPDCSELHLALAVVYLRELRLDDAKKALDNSLRLKPAAEAYRYLALYYDKRNDYQHAMQTLEQGLSLLGQCTD